MVAKLKVKDEHLKLKDKNNWETNDNYVLYHP